MIRHFGVFPVGVDKDNLFEEQKRFLMYLVGGIPSMENWQNNVEYQNRLAEIKLIDDITLSAEEIDLAQLHGSSIDEIKRNRLIQDKMQKIKELNEKYGVKTNDENIISVIADEQDEKATSTKDPQALWDILQGKGLINGNA